MAVDAVVSSLVCLNSEQWNVLEIVASNGPLHCARTCSWHTSCCFNAKGRNRPALPEVLILCGRHMLPFTADDKPTRSVHIVSFASLYKSWFRVFHSCQVDRFGSRDLDSFAPEVLAVSNHQSHQSEHCWVVFTNDDVMPLDLLFRRFRTDCESFSLCDDNLLPNHLEKNTNHFQVKPFCLHHCYCPSWRRENGHWEPRLSIIIMMPYGWNGRPWETQHVSSPNVVQPIFAWKKNRERDNKCG